MMDVRYVLFIIVKVIKYLAMIGICAAFFFTVWNGFHRLVYVNKDVRAKIDKEMKKSGIFYKYKTRMSQIGIMYRMNDYNLSPMWYLLVRIAVGVLLFMALVVAGVPIPIPVIGIPIGYIGVDLLFAHINKNDNKDFLIDIFNTYANLNIQMKSGLYITDALEYSYKGAKNERYKQAMEEMILNLSDKTVSMAEAIDTFHGRFLSPEIDNLCSMLENLLQYGIDDAYADNMLNEIKTIMLASSQEAEHDIESKAGMLTLAFFAVIIFIVVVAVMSGMSGIAMF